MVFFAHHRVTLGKPAVQNGYQLKGRPITTEEYERMLAKTAAVVGHKHTAAWEHYITGLWLSGLRLAESLELYWEDDTKLCVDLRHKHPMLRIPAELEKGNQDRLLAMAPEFAEFLLKTPLAERTGRVFNLRNRIGDGWATPQTVGSTLVKIGKATGVVVNRDNGKVKYAGAHDLRRAFGSRWAARVMPQILMELMRHEDIQTTLRFYVGRNAERTADVLWQAHQQAIAGNTHPETAENQRQFC